MRNIRVEITTFEDFTVPEATVFGGYKFILWDEPGVVQLRNQSTSEHFSVFSDVETGVYVVSAFAIDNEGNQLGGSVSTSVSVLPTELIIKAPVGLAVSFV